MKNRIALLCVLAVLLVVSLVVVASAAPASVDRNKNNTTYDNDGFNLKQSNLGRLSQKEELGKFLYFDKNLSEPRGQACADCHLPSAGFADPDSDLPVSEGVVEGLFGGRNSPTSAYAAYSPSIYFDGDKWIGGQFWDGRAATLVDQAKGPFLNPVEMHNPDKETVVRDVLRSCYVKLFVKVYGTQVLQDTDFAYDKIADAIAAYESSSEVCRFDSKFDFVQKGKAKFTNQEKRGFDLFNDPAKGNCATCHTSASQNGVPALFTDFTYDNLGIPKSTEYPIAGNPIDYGLGAIINDASENGKFKVPTLRNCADTLPLGHNGFFKKLEDMVHFYNKRDVLDIWGEPEVTENVNRDELGDLGLTVQEEKDIVSFLKTLTDGYKQKDKGHLCTP